MTCQICGGDTKVVDTARSSDEVIRRRKCKACGEVFYTVERDTNNKFAANLLVEYKTKKGITKT